jgi:hypothetical protein
VGCSLTLKDVANYWLRTNICGGITPLYNSTGLATRNIYCQWNSSCSDTGIMKILVCAHVCMCACVCASTCTHVCMYVCIIIFNLNRSQSICLIQKGVPSVYMNTYLSTNRLRSINNWLTLIIHMQMFQCIVHKDANNAMIGAHIDCNCASFKLILLTWYTNISL